LSGCQTVVEPRYVATGKLKPLPGASRVAVTVDVTDLRDINPKLIFKYFGGVYYVTADKQALAGAVQTGVRDGLRQLGFRETDPPNKAMTVSIAVCKIQNESNHPMYPPVWLGRFNWNVSVNSVRSTQRRNIEIADVWELYPSAPSDDWSLSLTDANKISSDFISLAVEATLNNKSVQAALLRAK
jgi:hypothetical protein